MGFDIQSQGEVYELSHSTMVPNRHFDGIVYLDYSRPMAAALPAGRLQRRRGP